MPQSASFKRAELGSLDPATVSSTESEVNRMLEDATESIACAEAETRHDGSRTHQSTAHARLDVIRNAWTIFATGRDARPQEFIEAEPVKNKSLTCPFCSGNENQTPQPSWVGRIARTDQSKFQIKTQPEAVESRDGRWNVRVVPNKYPAVQPWSTNSNGVVSEASQTASTQFQSSGSSLFQSKPVVGGHEVVIESRRHTRSLTDISAIEAELVFLAYRDRLLHFRSLPNVNYACVFKNVGQRAGASLAHSHSQILATSLIPPEIERSCARMQRHRATTGCCLMCDLVREEFRHKERVIASDELTVAYCPFASRLPMKVRVTTKQHQACFEDLDDQSLRAVSRMVYRGIGWLEKLQPNASYNYCLNTKPSGIQDASDAFHWSIDIFPRITQVAGFEWAGGSMINPVLPEDAARQYRYRAMAEDPRLTL
jgi:UDPglucose--hexose-1-phosphate uridylyltransferase